MLKFYIIRHGESAGNKEGRFRGRFDYPLNENGLNQAENIGKLLKNINFIEIHSSPLKRAYQTAEGILKYQQNRNLQITINESFNNMYFSVWEGQLKSEIIRKYPEEWEIWLKNPESLKINDSETVEEVAERAFNGLMKLVEKYSKLLENEKSKSINLDQKSINIAIVTHRVVIKALIAKALKIEKPYFWKIHIDNASYSILNYLPLTGFMLARLNGTEHLKDYVSEIY